MTNMPAVPTMAVMAVIVTDQRLCFSFFPCSFVGKRKFQGVYASQLNPSGGAM